MIRWLLLAAIIRIYHPVAIAALLDTPYTHVEVRGTVVFVRDEADGDVHFRVQDDRGTFVVCEIVPYHPLPRPVKGQQVIVRGIHRFDSEVRHMWNEVHPVETWSLQR